MRPCLHAAGDGTVERCELETRIAQVEQPVAEAEVAPHDSLARLFRPAADDGGNAVADAHDGAVHFIAEETGAAGVGAEGFTSEPVVGAPDDFGFDVVGEGVDEEFFADGHLGLVFYHILVKPRRLKDQKNLKNYVRFHRPPIQENDA